MAFEGLNIGPAQPRAPKAGLFLDAFDKGMTRAAVNRQTKIENQLNQARLENAERQVSSLEAYHKATAETQRMNALTNASKLQMEQQQLAADNAAVSQYGSLVSQVMGGVQKIGAGTTTPEAANAQQAVESRYLNQPVEQSQNDIEAFRDMIKIGIISPNPNVQAIAMNLSKILEAETTQEIATRNLNTEQFNELMSYMNTSKTDAAKNLRSMQEIFPNNPLLMRMNPDSAEDISALQAMASASKPKQVLRTQNFLYNGQKHVFREYQDGRTDVSILPQEMQRGVPTDTLINEILTKYNQNPELVALANGPPEKLQQAYELPYDHPKSIHKMFANAAIEEKSISAMADMLMAAGADGRGAEGFREILSGMKEQDPTGNKVYGGGLSADNIKMLFPDGVLTEAQAISMFPGADNQERAQAIKEYVRTTGHRITIKQ